MRRVFLLDPLHFADKRMQPLRNLACDTAVSCLGVVGKHKVMRHAGVTVPKSALCSDDVGCHHPVFVEQKLRAVRMVRSGSLSARLQLSPRGPTGLAFFVPVLEIVVVGRHLSCAATCLEDCLDDGVVLEPRRIIQLENVLANPLEEKALDTNSSVYKRK